VVYRTGRLGDRELYNLKAGLSIVTGEGERLDWLWGYGSLRYT